MKALRWKFIIVALSIGAAACDPESNSEPIPDAEKDNYIPRVNTKYHYSVIEDGVNIGTAEKGSYQAETLPVSNCTIYVQTSNLLKVA